MRTTTHIGSGEVATNPRVAAGAGIAFALLFASAMFLFESAVPAEPQSATTFTPEAISRLTWAVRIVPFAGIAFLWFIGAMRQRLGTREDQFFSSVMLGSGLLFVAMMFVAFGFISGLLTAGGQSDTGQAPTGGFTVEQNIAQQIFTIYALKMAAVFMATLSALWRKTSVMPLPFAVLTLVLAAVLLITTSFNTWMILVFPAWVLIVSIYIFAVGLPRSASASGDQRASATDGTTP